MTPLARTLLFAVLLLAPGSALAARASDPAAPARGPAAVTSTARHGSGMRRPAAPERVRSQPAPADTTVGGRPRVAPRTLEATRIEGEIPVPQVLFITTRDQRRFLEFQHHHYLKTSLELGRATPGPTRLVVTTPLPVQEKEESR
jgi:hypothetical protein